LRAPVALIGQHGEIYRGTYTPDGGGMRMTNGKTTCSNQTGEINVLRCSDGRTGIATLNFATADSGGGKVRFSDGTEGDFIIGAGASRI
jgi:hypothetical protein